MAARREGRLGITDPPLPVVYPGSKACRRKFLRYYPRGFEDEAYLEAERGYKWAAHIRWLESLNPMAYRLMLKRGQYDRIADLAVRIESRTNLLFSFEKMALRDAVKTREGARIFAQGLHAFLYGKAGDESRFEAWRDAVAELPRKRTRVLTWPVLTVFGFIARPEVHLILKPKVTRLAAESYGFDLGYSSKPDWETYAGLLEFGRTLSKDLRDWNPRDMIDIQGFIWVQGSDEYPE